MAVSLLAAAKLNQDPMAEALVAHFAETSAILANIPVHQVLGTSVSFNREQALGGAGLRNLNESLVKDLTGGDTMTARYLFSNPFTFSPTHNSATSANT